MRRDAIFYDVFAGHREHLVLGSLPRMGSVYRRVKQVVPGLVNVNVPAHARMHCYISYRKTSETEAKKAAFAALLTEPENFKTIVLVDDDIDVFNEPEVMWAIGTRCRAEKDVLLIPDWSDPGGTESFGLRILPRRNKGGTADDRHGHRRDQAGAAGGLPAARAGARRRGGRGGSRTDYQTVHRARTGDHSTVVNDSAMGGAPNCRSTRTSADAATAPIARIEVAVLNLPCNCVWSTGKGMGRVTRGQCA